MKLCPDDGILHPMTRLAISVVIGTYNQARILPKVLKGFESQTVSPTDFELIIVDSESDDGTAELLGKYKPEYGFRYIRQPNKGKAAARNRGIEESRADTVLITDADMIPHETLLLHHIRAHHTHHGPACFEGRTFNMHQLEWPTTDKNLYPYIGRNYGDGAKLGWYYFLTGNISFPKKLVLDMGGFDMDFKGYGWEDLELGYRLSKKKIPLYYLKDAINYHYHVVTKREESERAVKKGESARILLAKHPELKWFLGLNPLSRFVFNRIKGRGKTYQFIKKYFFESPLSPVRRFGNWFVHEYHYLEGITHQHPS